MINEIKGTQSKRFTFCTEKPEQKLRILINKTNGECGITPYNIKTISNQSSLREYFQP